MDELITIAITLPASKLTSVYALLGGAAAVPVSSGNPVGASTPTTVSTPAAPVSSPSEPISAVQTTTASTASTGSAEAEYDSAGVAWDPARHAATKTTTKDGLWRMKVGVSRPEHEGVVKTAGSAAGSATSASETPSVAAATTAPAVEEDDEFAAFRAAASQASTSTPARTWTDADLSKLCNQAAMTSGDPEKVKAIIAKYVSPEEVPHSRNIPAEKREEFAQDVEKSFSIQYAG